VGYLYARLNPLVGYLAADLLYLHKQEEGLYERLTLREFGLGEEDLDTLFSTGRSLKPKRAPLREIITALQETYCSSIGVEFLHIQRKPMRNWIIERMETTGGKKELSQEHKVRILTDLVKAEEFEHFLHATFIGQKRFSLEESEVLIPALHQIVDNAIETDVTDIVIGMSHRGRLNVLTNILNKPADDIFSAQKTSPGQCTPIRPFRKR
jgi:2-oxoglutarate dehydrogenase E1 component